MPGLELASDDPRALARGTLTPGPDQRCGAAGTKAVEALGDLRSDHHDWEVVTADALLLDSPFPEDELVEDSPLPDAELVEDSRLPEGEAAEVSVADELVDDADAVLAAACLAAVVVAADAPAAAEAAALAAVTESAGSRPEASCT